MVYTAPELVVENPASRVVLELLGSSEGADGVDKAGALVIAAVAPGICSGVVELSVPCAVLCAEL